MALCLKPIVCICFVFGYSAGCLENLALLKPAYMSSQFQSFGAENANDGDTNDSVVNGTCAHTKLNQNPWWTVDLGEVIVVEKVRLYNRGEENGECLICPARLHKFRVHLNDALTMDPPGQDSVLCYESHDDILPLVVEFNCKGVVSGRFLTVSIPRNEYLTLCEVEVFGRLPDTVTDIWTSFATEYEMTASYGLSTARLTSDSEWVTTQTVDTSALREWTMFPADIETPDSTSSVYFHDMTPFNTTMPWVTESYQDNGTSCQCPEPFCSPFTPVSIGKEAFLASILDELQIDQKNVSRERNRYVSVLDKRPSAQSIGSAGLVFIVVVFGSIVLLDAISLVKYLSTKGCSRCRTLSIAPTP